MGRFRRHLACLEDAVTEKRVGGMPRLLQNRINRLPKSGFEVAVHQSDGSNAGCRWELLSLRSGDLPYDARQTCLLYRAASTRS